MMTEQFFSLTPDAILASVEQALGARATGRTFALNSMENRVYDIELEDERRVVGKFYRPGRWSRDAILEEHAFLAELVEAEIPAVPPLVLANGSTIDLTPDGILFAIFDKVRGRSLQELDDAQLEQAGRLLARIHTVGERRAARHRLTITPKWALDSFEVVEEWVDIQLQSRYRRVTEAIARAIEPLFAGVPVHRVHGDCHLGNLLWQNERPFFLDFDDFAMAPAVQDVWMVVRGRDEDAARMRDVMLKAYESMRAFDRSTLRLVEPLRALRMIHYSAWIARRWDDPIFKRTFPEFVTYPYWAEEVDALEEQLRLIQAL
jgi:Ser/Thr protein kinase RdoA (MazF antagonist)